MNKKIKIIFTLSFILNIILVGVVMGGMYHNKSRHNMKGIEGPAKELLQKSMNDNRKIMSERRAEMKVLKQQLKEIVVAEEFDKTAFDTTMTDILVIKSAMSEKKAQTFGEVLSQLPQKDREAMSHKLLKEMSGKHRKRHKGSKHMKNNDK